MPSFSRFEPAFFIKLDFYVADTPTCLASSSSGNALVHQQGIVFVPHPSIFHPKVLRKCLTGNFYRACSSRLFKEAPNHAQFFDTHYFDFLFHPSFTCHPISEHISTQLNMRQDFLKFYTNFSFTF